MSFVNTVDLIGDEALAASIIGRSVVEIADSYSRYVGYGAFWGCSALESVIFVSAQKIVYAAFYKCSALSLADFHAANVIEGYAFSSCSALTSLILRSNTVCVSETTAFSGTPIASGTGYIYVPRALLSDEDSTKDYRRATNWSTYAAQFRALEDYTVDGTTTGELDPTKIAA